MTERYVELHAASAFSFLEGASLPEDLIQRAAELNMPAMALLDRNGVYGAARFHTLARKHGVRAHVGAEIAVSSLGNRLMPPAMVTASPCSRSRAPAPALQFARRISKSLPTDYPVQDARDDQVRGRSYARGPGRVFFRADLPDRRR